MPTYMMGFPGEPSKIMVYKKLGELLVDNGVITSLQLSVALAAQQTSNRRLGEILVEKGFTTDRQIAECLAEQFGYPLADLEGMKPQPNALTLLKADEALELNVLPISVTDTEFECIIDDPVDIIATDRVAQIVKRRLNLHLGYGEMLRARIRDAYGLDEGTEISEAVYPLPARFGGARPRRAIGSITLFDAVDHELDRRVTLASMPTNTGEERTWRARVQAAARVQSRFVASIYDWFEFEDRSWCVFERLEGETLSHILRTRGARSLSQSAETVACLAEGIDALHGRGGYVGLVCPDNVFVTPQGTLLLPLAAAPHEYSSPELDDGHLPTTACDLYSLGTLLWECLHGENPHVAAAHKAGLRFAWAEPQPHIGNLPTQLVDILAKTASKQPEKRFASALLLANALRAYNWNALAKPSTPSKTEAERAELLTVLGSESQGLAKPSFWQRIFGKAA